ncbi:MAG: hypothetical protein LBU69_01110 [Deltaproteobacteria bacterium]|nr:hypothetical protein [Deltaproteobacteria bacterium]
MADGASIINGQSSSGSVDPLIVGLDVSEQANLQAIVDANPGVVVMLSNGTKLQKASSPSTGGTGEYNCGGIPCTASQYQDWLQSQNNPADPGGSTSPAGGTNAGSSPGVFQGAEGDEDYFGVTTPADPVATAQGQVAERANAIVGVLGNEGIAVPEAEVQTFLSTLDEDTLASGLLVLYVMSEFDNSGLSLPNPRVVNATTANEVIAIDMLDVKSALAPVLNWSPNGAVAAPVAYAAVKEAISIVASPQFAQAHYAKNAEMYVSPPQTETALTSGEFGNPSDWQKVTSDATHNLGSGQGNVSYVYVGGDEKYKGYQYVFDASGNLVRDPANMGTYNVADPMVDGANHVWADILPWILLGSSESDPTSTSERLDAAISAFPQVVAEIGVEQLKLIVFSFQKVASQAARPTTGQIGV